MKRHVEFKLQTDMIKYFDAQIQFKQTKLQLEQRNDWNTYTFETRKQNNRKFYKLINYDQII